jgi:hypothetical protein
VRYYHIGNRDAGGYSYRVGVLRLCQIGCA